jgi:hypothetical protein
MWPTPRCSHGQRRQPHAVGDGPGPPGRGQGRGPPGLRAAQHRTAPPGHAAENDLSAIRHPKFLARSGRASDTSRTTRATRRVSLAILPRGRTARRPHEPATAGRSATCRSGRCASTPAATSTTAASRTCPPRGCGPPWPGLAGPPRGRPARRGPPGRLRAAGSASSWASWSCTGQSRCTTSAPSTCPATTASTPRRPSGPRPAAATWPPGPDAVDAAIGALDRVAAPVAEALLPAAKGLTAELEPFRGRPGGRAGLAAHKRPGRPPGGGRRRRPPDTALGRGRWSGCSAPARPSRSTWAGWRSGPTASGTGCGPCWTRPAGALAPGRPTAEVVAGCWTTTRRRGVLREAEAMTAEAIAFTLERDLVPGLDGECLVAPGAPVAPLGPGHDVLGRPVSSRRPLPLLHLPARARTGRPASRTTG